jgi:hypothetical protein
MSRMQRREKLKRPKSCHQEIYSVLLDCWRLDRQLRITPSRILDRFRAFATDPQNTSEPFAQLKWPVYDIGTAVPANSAPADTIGVDLNSPDILAAFARLEVLPSQVSIEKELGKGQFGSVSRAIFERPEGRQETVAVKTLLDQGVSTHEEQQFEYEAKLLSALNHRNIVRVIGVCFATEPHLIVLEFMSGGDLKGFLEKHSAELADDEPQLRKACRQVASAMWYLEQNRVVHRDLAARFVFFLLGFIPCAQECACWIVA